MREQFKRFRFSEATLTLIKQSNEIITALQAQGYILTLRQLYYQLVSRDIIANKQSEYKRLGSILNDARLHGLVDWDSIEDRTRNLAGVSHWNDPSDVIASAAHSFRIDKWKNQPFRIEVWVEKDALVGVLEKACRPLDVDWFSCRGYTSQSELYGAGKRLASYIRRGQIPVIIHLGDHDPSGIDMTRDIQERLTMFAEEQIEVRRIALNMDQVRQYNPPPNPAKSTDARFEGYRRNFGIESWELDALDPQVIDDLVSAAVSEYRNEKIWKKDAQVEATHRDALDDAATRWPEVAEFLKAS